MYSPAGVQRPHANFGNFTSLQSEFANSELDLGVDAKSMGGRKLQMLLQ